MNKFRLTINALAIAIVVVAFASIAQAQATRTWVSGVGDDVNPCSRTAPCKTFAGAISKTATNGEINALDPAGFGAVTITKSITIDGTPTYTAGILNAGTSGVIINITSGTDARKSVTLRGLSIQGAGTGTRGVAIIAAIGVFIYDCTVHGQNGAPGDGIQDTRSVNGNFLQIDHSRILNNTGNGISVVPAAGAPQINVHITNTLVQKNTTGFFAGSNVKATIYNSVFTQNTTAGISAQQTAGGTTDVNVDHCVVSNNQTGFAANTASSIIRVSNTTALNNQANNAGLAVALAGGAVSSYGNNQTGGVAFPSTGTGQTE